MFVQSSPQENTPLLKPAPTLAIGWHFCNSRKSKGLPTPDVCYQTYHRALKEGWRLDMVEYGLYVLLPPSSGIVVGKRRTRTVLVSRILRFFAVECTCVYIDGVKVAVPRLFYDYFFSECQ